MIDPFGLIELAGMAIVAAVVSTVTPVIEFAAPYDLIT